jgi:hypothetical protein
VADTRILIGLFINSNDQLENLCVDGRKIYMWVLEKEGVRRVDEFYSTEERVRRELASLMGSKCGRLLLTLN